MKDYFDKWKSDIGLSFINRPDVDLLERSLKSNGQELSNYSFNELDSIMVALANYNVFLNYKIGETSARITYLTDALDNKISVQTSKVIGGHYYERKALVLSENKELEDMSRMIVLEKSKLNMLEPVMFSVRNKLEIVRKIYERRIREIRS